ncbi:hypothetical protein LCGC14_2490630, partial [marine sediment metagenome]
MNNTAKEIPSPTPQDANRFWAKVNKCAPGNCWLWLGNHDRSGYGRFCFMGTNHAAHRVARKIATGESLAELHVMHTCDNPPCVNPSHLVVGTNADNLHDMAIKGR